MTTPDPAERVDRPAGSWVWDVAADRVALSHELYEIAGVPPGMAITTCASAVEYVDGADRDALAALVRRAVATAEAFHVTLKLLDADGRGSRWVDVRGSAVQDDTGAVVLVHGTASEVPARPGPTSPALSDPLTGLATRDHFLREAARAMARAERNGWYTTVLSVDLDQFHRVNVHAGDRAGDAALATLAARLGEAVRGTDVAGRRVDHAAWSGSDEFLLLCENTGAADAASIAERVLAAVSAPLDSGDGGTTLTASVGVTVVEPGTPAPTALADAEAAMRQAKARGGGRFHLSSSATRARTSAAAELANDLRDAVDEGQIAIVFQPKVSLTSDRIVGMEALLRWQHPERGLVSPAEFIPIAERTGLIVPLGAWMIEEGCRHASRWQRSHPDRPSRRVHVNVSPAQFHADLVGVFRSSLDRSGVAPGGVGIEVTESTVMNDVDAAIALLRDLVARDVRVSIDDFGTGYSSLAYLHRLPIHEVKIDKSFVDGLGRDAEDTAIVAAIISLAHAVDREVTAEGVERPDQLDRLRALGCDNAQGYLLARPMPAPELDVLLAAEDRGRRLGSIRVDGTLPLPEVPDTVLVADDVDDVRLLVRMALTTAGCTVHEARSGLQAIESARRLRPQCIVLDVGMPDMSGVDVCRQLRADPRLDGCTIVMLTSRGDAADKADAFSAGADDYIVKPFVPRDLVSRIRIAVRRRSQG